MSVSYRTLTVYMLSIFVGALDVNVLAPAMPVIAHGFHTSLAWIAWAVTGYTVAYAAATLLAGPTGDRLGRGTLLRIGLALFAVASLGAALSHSLPMFLAARVVQGMGAGAVYPNAQAEGMSQFPAEKRGMALGIFGAVFGLASIVGPNVGGALTQFYGWPAIFWFNAVVAVIVLFLSFRLPRGVRTARPMPDVGGALSFATLLAAGLLLLEVPGIGRLILFVVAVLAALVFAWRQRRSLHPFLDPRPFIQSSGGRMMLGAALIGLDMSAAVFIPALTQAKLHLSVLDSGVSLMPAAFSGALLAGVGGVLTDRRGARPVLLLGLAAGVVGGILLALPHLTMPIFIVAMLVFGAATAFTMGAPLNRMAVAVYADDQASEALSLIAVFRSVGLAAGPIFLTAALGAEGFTGMFGVVAVSSLVGLIVFAGMRGTGEGIRAQEA